MSKGEIHGNGCDEQPGPLIGPEQGQRENGDPGQGLSDDAPEDLRGLAGEPVGDFDGNQLSPCAQELGNGRKDAQLKRCRVEQEGKGREILLSSALGDGLEESISNAETPTGLVGPYWSRIVVRSVSW